jgi:hypothetical protein
MGEALLNACWRLYVLPSFWARSHFSSFKAAAQSVLVWCTKEGGNCNPNLRLQATLERNKRHSEEALAHLPPPHQFESLKGFFKSSKGSFTLAGIRKLTILTRRKYHWSVGDLPDIPVDVP